MLGRCILFTTKVQSWRYRRNSQILESGKSPLKGIKAKTSASPYFLISFFALRLRYHKTCYRVGFWPKAICANRHGPSNPTPSITEQIYSTPTSSARFSLHTTYPAGYLGIHWQSGNSSYWFMVTWWPLANRFMILCKGSTYMNIFCCSWPNDQGLKSAKCKCQGDDHLERRGSYLYTKWSSAIPDATCSTTDIFHPEIRATTSATSWPGTEEVMQCAFPFPLLF